jgi:hypothetical protein
VLTVIVAECLMSSALVQRVVMARFGYLCAVKPTAWCIKGQTCAAGGFVDEMLGDAR